MRNRCGDRSLNGRHIKVSSRCCLSHVALFLHITDWTYIQFYRNIGPCILLLFDNWDKTTKPCCLAFLVCIFLLEYNCFALFCSLLPYNKVNQLYVYIYVPSLLSFSSIPAPFHPSRSLQNSFLLISWMANSPVLSVTPLPYIVLLMNPEWDVCRKGGCRVGLTWGHSENEANPSLLHQCIPKRSVIIWNWVQCYYWTVHLK